MFYQRMVGRIDSVFNLVCLSLHRVVALLFELMNSLLAAGCSLLGVLN